MAIIKRQITIAELHTLLGCVNDEQIISNIPKSLKVVSGRGFKRIIGLYKTNKRNLIQIILENKKYIKGDYKHKILSKRGWLYLKNIIIGDFIKVSRSFSKVLEINMLNYKDNCYDLQVENAHSYYGNGILNHNTEMFVKLIADLNLPTLIVVNRTSLLGQLREKIVQRMGLRKSEFNVIGADWHDYHKENFITIATFQSLLSGKWDHVIRECKMIIVDETHHISCNELGRIATKAQNTLYRFGLSATPKRTDGADLMIEALIGPQIYYKSTSELIREGYLAKPYIYFVRVQHDSDIKLSYAALYKLLTQSEERNETIAKCAYHFAKHNKTVLISVVRLNHINRILKAIERIDDIGFNIKVVIGEDSTSEKVKIIKKMNTGEINIVISTLFGEGVDVPNLNVLINARAVKSENDAIQQVGRILRPKEDGEAPYVIDFYDYNPKVREWNHKARIWNETHAKKEQKPMKVDYFQRYAKRKIKIYQAEPEFEVAVVNDVEEIFKETL